MSDMLDYNGYRGTVEYSSADNILFGKVFGINDLVTYEGLSLRDLETSFRAAVDDYLETCKEIGKEPEKFFKGSFNVRVTPDLHRRASYEAEVLGQSLNEFVEKAIESSLENRVTKTVLPAPKLTRSIERATKRNSVVKRSVKRSGVSGHGNGKKKAR